MFQSSVSIVVIMRDDSHGFFGSLFFIFSMLAFDVHEKIVWAVQQVTVKENIVDLRALLGKMFFNFVPHE
jgi:hypothetical protein